jgi:hypothetical protein
MFRARHGLEELAEAFGLQEGEWRFFGLCNALEPAAVKPPISPDAFEQSP